MASITRKKSYEMDMCSGPLLGKILRFSIPLMLSGVLQLLFNAMDIVVVGRFVGNHALAAVGATSSLINLLVNLFVGLSVGTSVLVARYVGAKSGKDVEETVHTSVVFSIVGGVFLMVVGICLAGPLLRLMGTPEDVLPHSQVYMRIYFAGMVFFLFYNFGSAILRAVGDTKRPLYYLFAAGVLNICLNLFFVIVFHMGVAGVALATIISQALSAVLIFLCLMRIEGLCRLDVKKLKINARKMRLIVQIGLPAGLQGALFSISNVLIQSSINSFGSVVMAGNTAASNLEGFVYTAMNSFYQAAVSFTGQNLGGGKFSRLNRITRTCVLSVTVVGLILGNLVVIFGTHLASIYSSDPEVISYAMERLRIVCSIYFLCGVMDTLVGCMRGLGYSTVPMIVSLAGACGFRILWIFTIFQIFHSYEVLLLSYPASWLLTGAVHAICLAFVRRKFPKEDMPVQEA